MANTDTPFGLRPVQHRNGAPYNGATRPYYIPAAYATALFIGEAVTITGDGNAAEVSAPGAGTFGPGMLSTVAKTAAGDGNALSGVIVAFAANPSDLEQVHNPASNERIVFVADDPDLEFEIQADGTITAAMIGLNAVLIDTHAGDANTALAGTELDTTSDVPAADASNQLTIQRIVNRVDNELATANSVVAVFINNHTAAHGVVGIS